MRIRWYGQSAFLLTGEKTVAIDPFGEMGERAAARGTTPPRS
jgi:L-ascorbate metabolism protein UlaG (beta-lactamase superfamily)